MDTKSVNLETVANYASGHLETEHTYAATRAEVVSEFGQGSALDLHVTGPGVPKVRYLLTPSAAHQLGVVLKQAAKDYLRQKR